MYADIQEVIVFIYQSDSLLLPAMVHDLFEPVEAAHAMINVGYKISLFQIVQVTNAEGLFLSEAPPKPEAVITFKYLVISETYQLSLMVNEAFMQRDIHDIKDRLFAFFLSERHILKDGMQPFQLFRVSGQDQVFISIPSIFIKAGGQEVKVFIE